MIDLPLFLHFSPKINTMLKTIVVCLNIVTLLACYHHLSLINKHDKMCTVQYFKIVKSAKH